MENETLQQSIPSDWFVEGEVEAAFVFAEAAAEFRLTDSNRFQACLTDALDCYEAASGFLGDPGLSAEQRQILAVNLNELRRRLDLLRGTKAVPSAAA